MLRTLLVAGALVATVMYSSAGSRLDSAPDVDPEQFQPGMELPRPKGSPPPQKRRPVRPPLVRIEPSPEQTFRDFVGLVLRIYQQLSR